MFLPTTAGGDPLAISLPFALAASPTPSSASSTSSGARTSPSLFDLPTPPSAPISTPSPLASSSSSSLLLPFDAASPPMHPLDTFETSLSGLPNWSATIDPSLLFGLDPSTALSAGAHAKGPAASPVNDAPIPARSFFPPGSPITAQRELPRAIPLFGESSTLEQRQAQVAALSSLIVNGAAPTSASSAGPAKRTRAAAGGRSRSMSQGRPTAAPSTLAAAPNARGRRASVNTEAPSATQPRRSPPPPSSKSWLDALREAEAKAKLRRLQQQSGTAHGARKGRLALMHGQLLAASMQEEAQAVVAPTQPSGAIWSIFPTCRGDRDATCNPRCCRSVCTCGFDEDDQRFLDRQAGVQQQEAAAAAGGANMGGQSTRYEENRMAAPAFRGGGPAAPAHVKS